MPKVDEYRTIVHIIEAINLKGKDSTGMSDPVCFVHVGAAKKHTSTFHKTTAAAFDSIFFFDQKYSADEFSSIGGKVAVYDANAVSRNVLIGEWGFSLSAVRNQPQHEMYHTWVGLVDPAEPSGCAGYLRLSVTVLGPGDDLATHDPDAEEEGGGDSLSSSVVMPPSISYKGMELVVYIFRAEDLPKMDQGPTGKVDGYVVVSLGSETMRTRTIPKDYNPHFDTAIRLAYRLPAMANEIQIALWDEDKLKKDELIGRNYLDLASIARKPIRAARWLNFYGPRNKHDPEFTSYVGRLLIAAQVVEQKEPKSEVGPSPRADESLIRPVEHTLVCQLVSGSGLVSGCYVRFTVGRETAQSKNRSEKHGTVNWNETIVMPKLAFPKDRTQFPQILVQVFDKKLGAADVRLGYLLFTPDELWGFAKLAKTVPTWHALKRDAREQDGIPGFLLMRLGIGPSAEFVKLPELPEPKLQSYEIRCQLYQARNLPAADSNGLSDPFVMVQCGGRKAKSATVHKTLFPLWYETLVMKDVLLPTDMSHAPNVVLTVWDRDKGINAQDLLGHFQIPVAGMSADATQPKWYGLHVEDPEVVEGEVLAAFQLIPTDRADAVPQMPIAPPMRDCTVHISVVGLRNLVPCDRFRLNKPYFKIDVPGHASKQDIVSTSCDFPTAESPNHLQVFDVKLPLPVNPLFAPWLTVRVYDDRPGIDPLLGTAAIDLQPYMPWSRDPNVGVDLPPVVDVIPGAEPEPEQQQPAASAAQSDDEIEVVVDSGENTPLLQAAAKTVSKYGVEDARELAPDITGVRSLPDVAETVLGDPEPDDQVPLYDRELAHHLGAPPFVQWKMTLGKTRGLKRSQRDAGKGVSRVTGQIKGRIAVYESMEAPAPPNLKRELNPQDYIVRVYVYRGLQLVPMDPGGSSDPYVVLSTGVSSRHTIRDSKTVHKRTLYPNFFKLYELPATLPGQSKLTVSLYDWDAAGADDLIGSTEIDLENLVFSSTWQALEPKPREMRTLWSPASTRPQGKVEIAVDVVLENEAKSKPPIRLVPPTPRPFELRVVVWNTRDVVFKDDKMSDIFVTARIGDAKPQKTDIHWRSEDGTGMFNWRMVFPVTLPMRVPRLYIAVWDKDVSNPDDSIAEAVVDLTNLFKRAFKTNQRASFSRQFINMLHPNFEGVQGRCEITIDVLTAEEAANLPAGKGRGEPNSNPQLPKPQRPESSFPPWRGDKYAAKGLVAMRGALFKKYWWVLVLIIAATIGVPLLKDLWPRKK